MRARRSLILAELGLADYLPPEAAAAQPTPEPRANSSAAPLPTPSAPKAPQAAELIDARHLPFQGAMPASVPAAQVAGELGAIGRAERIAQLGWDALRAEVQACRACRLCDSRTQTVFGIGEPTARWVVIGEAPGAQEDEQGEPFVGQSGKLLDNMLASIGVARRPAAGQQAVYIANVLKCRPPANRNPEPEEVLRCEPFLKRQLQLLQPDIILAMGRFAITSLLGSKAPIAELRLRRHSYAGVPLVVTYHPAYLLRNLAEKARAWEDLCFARAWVSERRAGSAVTAPPA